MATKKPPSSTSKPAAPPSDAALKHANKITHRAADGTFKNPPTLKSKQPPPMPPPEVPTAEEFPTPLSGPYFYDDDEA